MGEETTITKEVQKVQKFWEDFQNKEKRVAVHCKTEEEAIDFCKQMHEHYFEWINSSSYLDHTNWDVHESETYYGNDGTYGELADYQREKDFTGMELTCYEWSDYCNIKIVFDTDETETKENEESKGEEKVEETNRTEETVTNEEVMQELKKLSTKLNAIDDNVYDVMAAQALIVLDILEFIGKDKDGDKTITEDEKVNMLAHMKVVDQIGRKIDKKTNQRKEDLKSMFDGMKIPKEIFDEVFKEFFKDIIK